MAGPRSTRRWASSALAVTALIGTATTAAAGDDPIITQTAGADAAYTGSPVDLRVPAGVTSIDVTACGAEGGRFIGVGLATTAPGRGAQATSSLSVTPGETLQLRVGGEGTTDGGFNGGGLSLDGPFFSQTAGGGGATDIRQGGDGLDDRVVVAGGGGGGAAGISGVQPLSNVGGDGGLVGADAPDNINPSTSTSGGFGGTATAGGAGGNGSVDGEAGALGVGGAGTEAAGGGGGGLYGGGGGSRSVAYATGGGGGSSLGDAVIDGACGGDGSLSVVYEQPLSVLPGADATVEPATSITVHVPVTLAFSVDEPVTVAWSTVDNLVGSGLAAPGSDFVSASGTVEIPAGATQATVPVEILGDDIAEPALLWGEWGLVTFSVASGNAILDTTAFFGAGLFIIVDND